MPVTLTPIGPQCGSFTTSTRAALWASLQAVKAAIDAGGGGAGPQGPVGPQGPQGNAGAAGADGPGVPAGGTTGQVLTKASNADFDSNWQSPAAGGGCPFPVLGVFISWSNADPSTYWPGTTWQARGVGKVLVGVNAADPDFAAAGATGGEKTHTLTTEEIPAHVHGETAPSSASSGAMKFGIDTNASGTQAAGLDTASAGGGAAHNNMPPFVCVYIWARIT